MVTKKTSAFALAILLCALASALCISARASAAPVGTIAKNAGVSMAIDEEVVYWISGGKLVKGTAGGEAGIELGPKSVQRVSAGGGFYAYSTLATKNLRKGKQSFKRSLYRSIEGSKTRRLATTTEYLRSGLYCGAGIGLWGIDGDGKLLYHITTNQKKNKCTNKYATSFFNVGSSKVSPKKRVFKTAEGLLGAQGTRVATKVRSRKGKIEVRSTDFSRPGKGATRPLLGPSSFQPISASFDASGNAIVTTEGKAKGKPSRSAFVGNQEFAPTTGQWRYRACGRSVVRWIDEAISGGKKAGIEVVKNPLDQNSEAARPILSEQKGSIRALTCDRQRLAYVLAKSADAKASATVNVEKIDITKPVVVINAPGSGANTTASSIQVDFTVTEDVSPDKINCSLSNNGAAGQSFTSGKSVQLAMGANSLSVSCDDAVGNRSIPAVVLVNRGTAPDVTITTPADNGNVTTSQTAVTWTTTGTTPTACDVNGSAGTSPAIVNLAQGANVITVTCSNAFGSDSANVVVNRGSAPTVTITTPATTPSYTSNSTASIAWTQTGTAPISCTVNGDAATSPAIVDLDPGPNNIDVTCTNNFGSDSDTAVINQGPAPDAVVITSPGPSSTTSSASRTVSYTVGGVSTVPTGVTCTITNSTNDDEDVQNAGDATSGTVSLQSGANSIAVSCANLYGTTASTSITVTRTT